MAWPDHSPNQPRNNQHADHIASPDMHRKQVILGEIGNGKGRDQGPMEEPHKRVPYIDLLLMCTAHWNAFSSRREGWTLISIKSPGLTQP